MRMNGLIEGVRSMRCCFTKVGRSTVTIPIILEWVLRQHVTSVRPYPYLALYVG